MPLKTTIRNLLEGRFDCYTLAPALPSTQFKPSPCFISWVSLHFLRPGWDILSAASCLSPADKPCPTPSLHWHVQSSYEAIEPPFCSFPHLMLFAIMGLCKIYVPSFRHRFSAICLFFHRFCAVMFFFIWLRSLIKAAGKLAPIWSILYHQKIICHHYVWAVSYLGSFVFRQLQVFCTIF